MTPAFSYLIGFVVILWVVAEDLWLFCVFETPHEIVYPEIFPPFLAFREPVDSSAMGGKWNLLLESTFALQGPR